MSSEPARAAPERRLWHFGNAVFDEARWELRVAGERRPLEGKPVAVLLALLERAGETVTKDELLTVAWPGVIVVEASLTTAVAKLRAALGDESRAIVEAVPRVGYRLGVKVTTSGAAGFTEWAPQAGDTLGLRPQWRLEQQLGVASGRAGDGTGRQAWLVRHAKTGEARVFKFAAGAAGLASLRREAALARVLLAALGRRRDLLPVAEWNFDAPPFFIELPYGGPDLAAWCADAGGLAAIPLARRLAIAAAVSATVADAHRAGVIHKDIKPANILIGIDEAGDPAPVLIDFGSGRVDGADRMTALGITVQMDAGAATGATSYTTLYAAPELLAGLPATTATDIFALGILLYQLVVGDLARPLAAGWEAGVDDPLLRLDIAAAAAGDPALRLPEAGELARRLNGLAARRAAAAAEAARAARDAADRAAAARARQRRPWVAALVASLAVGVVGSAFLARLAIRERDEAARAAARATAVNRFLTEDLLARGDPARATGADETLMAATRAAARVVDTRFAEDRTVAAAIHLALATAYDQRSAWQDARVEYDRAIAALGAAYGARSPQVALATLRLAALEALSFEAGSLERSARLADSVALTPALGASLAEARVLADLVRGTRNLAGGDIDAAVAAFRATSAGAEKLPAVFDETQRLRFAQRVAFAELRAGHLDEADGHLRGLLTRQLALHGPDHPDTLILRMNLGQEKMLRHEGDSAADALISLRPAFLRRFGARHRLTLQLEAALAQSLGEAGRFAESAEAAMSLYQEAVAAQGEQSFRAIAARTDMATSLCRAGRLADGLAHADGAYASAGKAFGAKNELTLATREVCAECRILAGRAGEAAPFLAGLDGDAVGHLTADRQNAAWVSLLRAQVALAGGDAVAARGLLAAAAPVFAQPGGDRYAKQWAERLARDLASRADAR